MNKVFMFKVIIFAILSFIFTSFISLHDGFWGYLDAGYEFEPMQDYGKIFFLLFSTLSVDTFFGYDSGVLGGARFFGGIFEVGFKYLFGYNIGLTGFISLFFLGSFFSSYFLLREFFNKNLSYIGGLFFTFNPISLYFISQPGFILSYFSGILFILSIVLIIKHNNVIAGSLLMISSIFLLFSYPRLLGIYLLIFLLLFVVNVPYIFSFFIKNKAKVVIIIMTTLVALLPLIIKLFYLYVIEKDYFSGVGNYAAVYKDWGYLLYEGIKRDYFYNGLFLGEITENYQAYLQSNIYYKLFLLVFVLYFTFISFFLKKIRYKKYFYGFISLLLIIILLRQLSKFTTPDAFVKIYYGYYPFIANNASWLNVLFISILSFFIPYSLLHFANNKNISRLSYILIFIFFFFLIIPFIKNEKLALITAQKGNYENTFYKNIYSVPESSFFLPGVGLLMSWSDYPINQIGGLNRHKNIFTNNSRLVNSKQANLNDLISNLNITSNTENNRIFNLKNVFIFKDIRNAIPGQFDFYPVRDYVGESKRSYREFLTNTGFYIKQDNENFAQFGLLDDERYEYFLYSPRKIDRRDMESFFSGELDILEKPVIIDPDSFHKPAIIDSYEIPVENQNIVIRYKQSVLEPTKIYAKLANFDSSKPFLLQLNQTFGMSWKVKWITKDEFDEKPCIDEYKEYSITQNKVCQFDATLLDIRDVKYLDNLSVSDEHHFEGNFVGNTWMITPDDIPENMRGESDLYAVILYEKQVWYSGVLLISGITFLLLVLLSVIQGIRGFRKRRRHLAKEENTI